MPEEVFPSLEENEYAALELQALQNLDGLTADALECDLDVLAQLDDAAEHADEWAIDDDFIAMAQGDVAIQDDGSAPKWTRHRGHNADVEGEEDWDTEEENNNDDDDGASVGSDVAYVEDMPLFVHTHFTVTFWIKYQQKSCLYFLCI